MEQSKLYNLLDVAVFRKWENEIIEKESNTSFFAEAQKSFEELNKDLNDYEKKLLKYYSVAFKDKLDHIYYKLTIKILNFGIKIGIDLGKSFKDFD